MSRRAEVLVDAFPGLAGGGGIGRYVRDLSHALLTLPDAPPARFLVARNFRDRGREMYHPEERLELPLRWRELAFLIMAGARLGIRFDAMYGYPAVVHSTLGYGPRFRDARLINHIHDLTFLEHPEWHRGRTSALLSATAPVAARAASVVLSHSDHVRRRVIEVFGVAPERTIVIPPPLGHGFRPIEPNEARKHVARRFDLHGDFLLHVGTLEPRKNHIRLIEAFEHVRRAGFPGPLVLVGDDGWRMEPILARLSASREATNIRRVTGIADEDLVALYGACTACAFPSLEEGFGMPLLESMACGAACVISDHPALVELAAGCALQVRATDVEALSEALLRLWKDPALRESYGVAGRVRSEAYAFPRWAERIFALYARELAAASG